MNTVIITIVGRPNVGKSTLFNALAKKRIAIVDDVAGTTRDRVSLIIKHGGYNIELIDTGGMGLDPKNKTEDAKLWPQVQQQIAYAISKSHIILFEVDIRAGLTGLDKEIAEALRRHNKPIITIANKADNQKHDLGLSDFYNLGFKGPVAISALRSRGVTDLWNIIGGIVRELSLDKDIAGAPADAPTEIKFAIVGKRNVGKSTLVNSLAKEERVIVSDVPGTTRDSIDVSVKYKDKIYTVIDTAGLKKKPKTTYAVDLYSRYRTEEAVVRADVVLFLIDATQKTSEVDKKITSFIIEKAKPVIIIINKWDLARATSNTDDYFEYLNKTLPFAKFAPILFISALEGFNTENIFDVGSQLYTQARIRVTTPVLNRAIEKIRSRIPSGGRVGKFLKIYYATQTGVNPPEINFVVNHPELFSDVTLRYINGQMRKILPFKEVPIKINIKGHRT